MASSAMSPDWIKKFSDPYAVLGVSVSADERRIAKRYRQVAKKLHPDQHISVEAELKEFSNQVLSRLVNPSYQRLKQDKGRAETLATLRFKVRRLSREQKLIARGPLAKQLIEAEESEVEVLYEKALTELSETQYVSAEVFAKQTLAIAELNLIYLRRKMGDPVIREKRTGLVSAAAVAPSPVSTAGAATPPPVGATTTVPEPPTSYAQRHVNRGKAYVANKNYPQAIQEFRDAVRLEPTNSNYHTMLGQAYIFQKMTGMAKVHIRQALKLDAQNATALKYAEKLAIDISDILTPPTAHAQADAHVHTNGHDKKGGLFNFFSRKRSVK